MMGIAVATATAGIVVGTMTLTGMSQRMTDLVEVISGGNVIFMLLLTAAICLIIGLGIPTTASYILVASLMAPVIVELGAQAGVAIPLIAVHLFVFYFGIMADVTPPVGLAAFAAAAISGEDPNKIGWQGTVYSMRTAILPFVFIFNPQMLLIGVESWAQTAIVVAASTAAILLFAAASMNWFVTRSRWWESIILLVACFALFRPDWFINQLYPPTIELPANQLMTVVGQAPADNRLTLVVEGQNIEGEDVRKTVSLDLGDQKPTPQERLRAAGLTIAGLGEQLTISNVAFGSYAKRIGLEPGYQVVSVIQPAPGRPSTFWVYLPALGFASVIWWLQRRRVKPAPSADSSAVIAA
jgi:hypothetical protein